MRELTSTESLQELQRKLYEKAKAEPKFRFYSLYDKTYRADVLAEAYRKVKANGGTSGIDEETCAVIEERGLEEYLTGLQLEMKERRYEPKPVKRVYIPKANGKMRPLALAMHSPLFLRLLCISRDPSLHSAFTEHHQYYDLIRHPASFLRFRFLIRRLFSHLFNEASEDFPSSVPHFLTMLPLAPRRCHVPPILCT